MAQKRTVVDPTATIGRTLLGGLIGSNKQETITDIDQLIGRNLGDTVIQNAQQKAAEKIFGGDLPPLSTAEMNEIQNESRRIGHGIFTPLIVKQKVRARQEQNVERQALLDDLEADMKRPKGDPERIEPGSKDHKLAIAALTQRFPGDELVKLTLEEQAELHEKEQNALVDAALAKRALPLIGHPNDPNVQAIAAGHASGVISSEDLQKFAAKTAFSNLTQAKTDARKEVAAEKKRTADIEKERADIKKNHAMLDFVARLHPDINIDMVNEAKRNDVPVKEFLSLVNQAKPKGVEGMVLGLRKSMLNGEIPPVATGLILRINNLISDEAFVTMYGVTPQEATMPNIQNAINRKAQQRASGLSPEKFDAAMAETEQAEIEFSKQHGIPAADTGTAGQETRPVTVLSPEEALALPDGTRAVDSEGNVMTITPELKEQIRQQSGGR